MPGEASALCEVDPPVAVVTLNEPARRNPLSPALVAGLSEHLGAGADLMTWCDVVVADELTTIGYPEVKAGVPAATVIPTLQRLVGRRRMLELTLLGEPIAPAEAERIGLISRVAPARSALTVARDLATRMAANDPQAMRQTKEIARHTAAMPYREAISYDDLAAVNPRLIYCSISGYGRTGPRADEPAYDAIMQAFTGMMASTGAPGGDPLRASLSIRDIGAAMYANQAILLALAARARTGRGQQVEASMFDTQIARLLYRAVGYYATGSVPSAKLGSAAPHVVPYQAYPTADGHIIAGALNDGLFRRMVDAMGLAELADDPRFAGNSDRVANRDELTRLLTERFITEGVEYWASRLTAGGVPNSPVNSVEDVLNDPHTQARQMIASFEHPRLGHIKFPSIPIKFSDTPGTVRLPPPDLGQHQDEVLSPTQVVLLIEAATPAEGS